MEMRARSEEIQFMFNGNELGGTLVMPSNPIGVVLFAHGSGSSRFSPRNKFVATQLNQHNIATLLVDLLTEKEDEEDFQNRFDIELLTERLLAVIGWLKKDVRTKLLDIGLFGASTGAAAAIKAATAEEKTIKAVVCRGGRVDMAKHDLPFVEAPILLIVGENDEGVLELNRNAYANITSEKKFEVVAKATHLFEEPGTLEAVAKLATDWFLTHFVTQPVTAIP